MKNNYFFSFISFVYLFIYFFFFTDIHIIKCMCVNECKVVQNDCVGV